MMNWVILVDLFLKYAMCTVLQKDINNDEK